MGHSSRARSSDAPGLGDLAEDPAISVFRTLVSESRSGLIARALHFTTVLMLAGWGPERVRAVLRDYESQAYPDAFASGEADRFATFLEGQLDRLPPVPYLPDVLGFEHALVRAALYGERATVRWGIDPVELFEALDEGRVPVGLATRESAMEIVPE